MCNCTSINPSVYVACLVCNTGLNKLELIVKTLLGAVAVLLVSTAAFDVIDHNILIAKLKYYVFHQ